MCVFCVYDENKTTLKTNYEVFKLIFERGTLLPKAAWKM